jgi:hypothetical protein
VTSYAPGDRVTVQLGAAYNAASDYLWDGSFLPSTVSDETPSCAASDGLQTGAAVTFTLLGPSDGFAEACKPWRADFQPEMLTPVDGALDDPDLSGGEEPYLMGVSIGVSFADGVQGGIQVSAMRALLTPSMNPNGALEARQPPPLAVMREIGRDGDGPCFDAWVASVETAP